MPTIITRGAVSAKAFGWSSGGPPAIGAAFGGGFYAGDISTTANGIATHRLVVGPVSSAQSSLQWKTANTSTAGTSSSIDGPSNSAAMNDATHPAAQFCEALSIGGFTNWYMPAKDELEVCYFNLKPSTTSNVTTNGTNAYSVPARASNYTAGTPARTSATDFQSGGAQAFSSGALPGRCYWASTELTSTRGWNQYFSSGAQYAMGSKTTYYSVRAIRRVAI